MVAAGCFLEGGGANNGHVVLLPTFTNSVYCRGSVGVLRRCLCLEYRLSTNMEASLEVHTTNALPYRPPSLAPLSRRVAGLPASQRVVLLLLPTSTLMLSRQRVPVTCSQLSFCRSPLLPQGCWPPAPSACGCCRCCQQALCCCHVSW